LDHPPKGNTPETDDDAYVAPAVAWEEWLDVKATLVMACAKVNPISQAPCAQGPPAS
jgi:hypothetical protein